jgi:hypothetical protein
LLAVALGAIVMACLLMLITLARYEFKVNAKLAARGDSGARVPSIASRVDGPSTGFLLS